MLLHSNTENVTDKNSTLIKSFLSPGGDIIESWLCYILINSYWGKKVPFFVVLFLFAMFRKVIQTLKKDSL
jgi:uncharacterized membrane protein